MEIKLNAGDKINIPAGCKATIEDDLIVIEEKQEERKEFKEGDILKCIESDNIVILKNRYNQTSAFRIYFSLMGKSNRLCLYNSFRHATEEERRAFFDTLKEKGLRWNAETKELEKIRERAEIGERYLYISQNGEIFDDEELRTVFHDKNYNSGNYYLLSEREQVEEDAKAIKAIFEKRLKV